MSLDQLDDQLAKLKKEQFNRRFQRASGQLETTSRIREVRRDIARVKPGRIMFELDGVPDKVAREAVVLGAAKLPIKTRIVTRVG